MQKLNFYLKSQPTYLNKKNSSECIFLKASVIWKLQNSKPSILEAEQVYTTLLIQALSSKTRNDQVVKLEAAVFL